jgi:hypothetical protein
VLLPMFQDGFLDIVSPLNDDMLLSSRIGALKNTMLLWLSFTFS